MRYCLVSPPAAAPRLLRISPDPHPGTLFSDPAQANCGYPPAPMCVKNFAILGWGGVWGVAWL